MAKFGIFQKFRWLQLLTGIHYIHHTRWSFGYTFWPLPIGYFPPYKCNCSGSDRDVGHRVYYGFRLIKPGHYHDCTWTGIY
jgi:hypothetical protein